MNATLVLSIFLCFCSPFSSQNYVAIHGRLLNNITSELEKQYKLEVYYKAASLMKNIEGFRVGFKCPYRVDNCSAKKLYRSVLDKFYHVYNSNEKVRPHLADFPFERSRIGIRIRFNSNINDDEISIIFNSKDFIYIDYGNGNEEKISYEDFYKSTGI